MSARAADTEFATMSAPPPLPPGTPAATGTVPASPKTGAHKTGMSGCAIAAIVAAVAGVIGVFVVGILAAIAVPAYQDYVVRARTQEAFQVAQTLQPRIDEERARSGTCPGNLEIGYGRSAVFELGGEEGAAKGSHMRLSAGTADDGDCAFELRFQDIAAAVDGKTLVFRSGDDGWRCLEGTLEDRHRPTPCRSTDTTP
jgi:type IV pilus assembly protein PilA